MKTLDFKKRHHFINFIKSINLIGLRWLSHRIPQIIIPQPKEEVIINTIHDFKMIINPVLDSGVESSIYYTGSYEIGTLNIIKKYLNRNDYFLDIGANIGLMSIYASKIIGDNGKVYSVEANPNTIAILEKNINLNKIKNIEILPFAVGSKMDRGKIYSNLNWNRGSASLVNIDKESISYDINIIPLDEYFKKIPPFKLIKIDIEGFELEALKGMKKLLKACPNAVLIIECGEPIINTEYSKFSVFNFIKELNHYNIYKLSTGKSKGSKLKKINFEDELPMHDNIICLPKKNTNH
jgi:FkbM family methyltransferase